MLEQETSKTSILSKTELGNTNAKLFNTNVNCYFDVSSQFGPYKDQTKIKTFSMLPSYSDTNTNWGQAWNTFLKPMLALSLALTTMRVEWAVDTSEIETRKFPSGKFWDWCSAMLLGNTAKMCKKFLVILWLSLLLTQHHQLYGISYHGCYGDVSRARMDWLCDTEHWTWLIKN